MTHITIEKAKLEQWLEALENHEGNYKLGDAGCDRHDKAITSIKAALAQPAQETVAWPIETNNQIEVLAKQCGWDNRLYMTPADYQIWCDRMRQFVQLASPPAQPAQPAPAQTDSFQFDIDEDVQLLMDRDMGDN
jgi:hypothetical protein